MTRPPDPRGADRPRLLDLFCGAGGAGMGYHRAGFDVVGVDINPQPRYPFEFIQADALEYCAAHGHEFDAIHASPPCQAYSSATLDHSKHVDLYVPTRELLQGSSRPFVIENVIGAPYQSGIIMCGSMFGMRIRRHRNFEASILMFQPVCQHAGRERPITITGHGGAKWKEYKHSRKAPVSVWPELMGMPWATWKEAAQAIPPAYTEFIGRQLLEALNYANE